VWEITREVPVDVGYSQDGDGASSAREARRQAQCSDVLATREVVGKDVDAQRQIGHIVGHHGHGNGFVRLEVGRYAHKHASSLNRQNPDQGIETVRGVAYLAGVRQA
jgi:hypothetical protein